MVMMNRTPVMATPPSSQLTRAAGEPRMPDLDLTGRVAIKCKGGAADQRQEEAGDDVTDVVDVVVELRRAFVLHQQQVRRRISHRRECRGAAPWTPPVDWAANGQLGNRPATAGRDAGGPASPVFCCYANYCWRPPRAADLWVSGHVGGTEALAYKGRIDDSRTAKRPERGAQPR